MDQKSFHRGNVGVETVPNMMNVGNVGTKRRRRSPLCHRMANKSGRLFEAMSEAAGIPGEDVKLWLATYYDSLA